MNPSVDDIIALFEKIAPVSLAEEWDNVGLQVGQGDWPVQKIWIALDPTPDVVENACGHNVNLLITHHPLIFKPLKSIDFKTTRGAIIKMAALHQLAVFAAHTNLDSVSEGLNDCLIKKIGLRNIDVLKDGNIPKKSEAGLGRIGELKKEITFRKFIIDIKEKLALSQVKVAGNPELAVKKVAVCTGSGSSLMPEFILSGAQVFISGDLRYHDATAAEALGLGLLDIGHFQSERLFIELVAEKLAKLLVQKKMDVKIEACNLENDPFRII